MKTKIRLSAVVEVILLTAMPALAADLAVGPGKTYPRIEQALRSVPGNKGDRVALSGKGYDYSGRGSIPRAIFQFNRGADGCVLDGFELSGAHNDSHNGAGVRINQANHVIVRNCEVHDNDMGIMSNGDGTDKTARDQWIESCLIRSNGNLADPGYNHNLYLGGTSVTLYGCEIHSSLTGHNVKSRAHQTTVIACYIHDSCNRELDLVDAKGDTDRPGSDAWLIGNVIVKAGNCRGNRAMIHFGGDGGNEHDSTLRLINNTIVTPYVSPVVQLSAAKAKVEFVNNILSDASGRQDGQRLMDVGKTAKDAVSGSCNWLSAGFAVGIEGLKLDKTHVAAGDNPPFADPAKGDYRLTKPYKATVSAGLPVEKSLPRLQDWLPQYKSPLQVIHRSDPNKPALGACEYVVSSKP
jgi:hypothetical protein